MFKTLFTLCIYSVFQILHASANLSWKWFVLDKSLKVIMQQDFRFVHQLMQNIKYKNTTSTELTKMFQKIKFNTIVSHITTTSLCLTCVAFITTTYFFQTQLFSLMLLLFQTYLCLKPLTSQQPTRWG